MKPREYLYKKGLQYKEVDRAGKSVAILNCPVCGDTENRFAISLEDGAFNCLHKNRCGVKGSFWDLQKLFGDRPVISNEIKIESFSKIIYKKPAKGKSKKLSSAALEFLKGRGFTDETIKDFKIGQTKDGKGIMFPYLKDGQLVNIKYRSLTEKKFWKEKDAEPTLFNRDNCTGTEVTICEGECDVMALVQYGIPAVSIPSGAADLTWIENEWEWLEKFDKILLLYDMDTAGQSAILKVAKRLGYWRCFKASLPHKDANECLIKGVEADEIKKCIMSMTPFRPKDLISYAEARDEIIDRIKKGKSHGVKIVWPEIQKMLRGWRGGELTVWTGSNGSGKTTIINEVIIGLIRENEKTCIVSLEMPVVDFIRWTIMQYIGVGELTAKEVENALEEIGHNAYAIKRTGRIEADKILSRFEYAHRRHGVRHFFIDSLMRVGLDKRNELAEQSQFVGSLVDFAQDYDCHVHLVAHPRKGDRDSDKPGKVDVSGSGDITNLAHNVFTIWRPTEELREKANMKNKIISDSILYLRKNREWGACGSVDMRFDEETKRIREMN